jgi:PhoH-like ATPase
MPLPKAPNKPATLLSGSDQSTKTKVTEHSQAKAPAPKHLTAKPIHSSAPSAPASHQPVQRTLPAVSFIEANRQKKAARVDGKKLFVLDTNVLMHDPASLFRFAEHDIFLPMVTLEELDHNKKGMSEVARNARQTSRWLDGIAAQADSAAALPIEQGLPLNVLGNTDATGRLFFQTKPLVAAVDLDLPVGKADNQIIAVVSALQKQFADHQVVLVSKDINMRIKARALALPTEDYHNDQVIDDAQLLYTGAMALPDDFWEKQTKGIESWQQQSSTFYKFSGPLVNQLQINQLVHLEGALPLQAQVKEITGKQVTLQTLRDYTHAKNAVWGMTARNREQNFALNLLMNQDIDFVTLLGQAGTGKTLLALAAALVQTIEARRYTEIIVTRATVPVGEDIGYLPGTEEEKMQPWMGALEDNLEVLMQGQGGTAAGGEWGRAATQDLIKARIRVKAMSFMRGRTFINKFLIIDEAQNLTPKQMKTLVTRAGPGTKVVCMGNIAQIDTPYLTESSSGLTYVVDRFRGWAHAGHIVLQRGERSRLADYASEAL